MLKYLSIDSKKCVNCRICEIWCSFTKIGECGPAYSRVQLYSNEKEGVTIPIICRHCAEGQCMDACLTDAIKADPDTGAILLDDELCTGCRECVSACPFGAIFLQPDGKIVKCDLCKGLAEPVCASHCPQGAIIWQKPELVTAAKHKELSERMIQALSGAKEKTEEYISG